MRPPVLSAAALALAVVAAATALPSAAGDGSPGTTRVTIVSPETGAPTSAALDVRVAYAGDDPEVGVHLVALAQGENLLVKQAMRPARSTGEVALSLDVSELAEGTHEIRARAYEGKSRLAPYGESAPFEIVVDRTPPSVAVDSPEPGARVADPELAIAGSASDALSGLAGVSCDGVAAELAGDAFSCAVALDEGESTIVVEARDRAGNLATTALPVTYAPGGLTALPGPPEAQALGAVEDVTTSAASVSFSEVTGALVRTQVELVFARDATVGQVNDLLADLRGRIVSQREGVLISVVRIPDPGSAEALDALLASLSTSPVLRAANPVVLTPTAEIPGVIDAGTAEVSLLHHQLAVRGHAAWNARGALQSSAPPTLVLGDEFGDGAPAELFGLNVRDADYASGAAASGHGYHVLGIAATAFDPVPGAGLIADAVTGMYPGALDVRAVDMQVGLGSATIADRLLEEVEDAPGNVVVNTSLQAPCETPADEAAYCTFDAARERGLWWIERVRGTDPAYSLEGKFLHVTAAGNRAAGVAPHRAAIGGWDAASAALLELYVGSGTDVVRVPNLTNTLVVENVASAGPEPYSVGCRSESSETGGTIAAIGENVLSFASPTTTMLASGTSQATPQVAGLAAYVWALRPALSPDALAALLRETGGEAHASCAGGPPVVDAYAAVLAADEGDADRPARRAILDAADAAGEPGADGAFDDHDLLLHVERFDTENGTIDYGRSDLNGDGRTGGAGLARLDLDADGAYGQLTLEIEGAETLFDERALTDLQALCWLAYSPLYAGAESARAQLGRERCAPSTVTYRSFSIGEPSCNTPEHPNEPVHCTQTTSSREGEYELEVTLRPDGLLHVRGTGEETATTVVSSTINCGSHTAVETWEGVADGLVHPDAGELTLSGPETRTVTGCDTFTTVGLGSRRLHFTVARDVDGTPVALDFDRELGDQRWTGYITIRSG